jgi:zinc transport system ATP-binding protein
MLVAVDPIHVRGAQAIRGSRLVLDDADLRLSAGEFVALLGPNGAGKSTLIGVLLGLLPRSAGSVELFGVPLERFRDWRRVGYVPQRPAAAGGVPATVLEVALLGRLGRDRVLGGWSADDRRAARSAIATVGLADRESDNAADLSGGQQQRLRVARALAGAPDVLVLDEPFSWVDVETEEDLVGTLSSFRENGGAVVFVAHDLHAVEHIVDRVVVLRSGRVVAVGAPAEVAITEEAHRHEHEPPAP